MGIRDEIANAACLAVVKQENELVTQALALHVGVKNPNPYDYLNRMSRVDLNHGYVVNLDGRAIITIYKPTFTLSGLTTEIKVQYQLVEPEPVK